MSKIFILLSFFFISKYASSQDLFFLAKINLPKCENNQSKIVNNICTCIDGEYLIEYNVKILNDSLVRLRQYFMYDLDSNLLIRAEYIYDTLINITLYDNEQNEVYEFEKGLLNGNYYSYWKNGKIRMTGNYKDNQRLGKWISYHQNGIIESEGAYFPKLIQIEVDNCLDSIFIINNFGETIDTYNFSKAKMKELLTKYYISSLFPFLNILI